jgi:uncharacterized protein (TIGR03086 family)
MADEVIDRYTDLADQFAARVEAAPDDAWDNPAPCEGWKARDVLDHILGSQRSVVAAVTGSEPAVASSDPKAQWRETYGAFKEAVKQPGALQKTMPGPMGEMPVEMMVGRFLSSDILVHTWDLARAVGGDEKIDANAVTQAYSGLKPMDAMLRQPGIFGPKVEPASDADEQEQFLNFLGRVTRP